jgi:hypothetical protein
MFMKKLKSRSKLKKTYLQSKYFQLKWKISLFKISIIIASQCEFGIFSIHNWIKCFFECVFLFNKKRREFKKSKEYTKNGFDDP